MNTTTIESAPKRAPGNRDRHALRRLRRVASCAAIGMCVAVAVWAQRPQTVPDPEQTVEEAKPILGTAPLPAQCPSRVILAGDQDGFTAGNSADITAPSAALKATIGPPYTDFDGTQADKHLIHTFRLPPCKCLVGAKLEFRGKSLAAPPSNDTITLGFSTIPGFPRWYQSLASLTPPGPVYSLDLAALPPNSMSLLSAMQTNGYLDFYVQDDTSIDYAKLTLTMCDCCQPQGRAEICITKFHDRDRDGVKDANEPFLQGWAFQANDQAGGNLVTSGPTNDHGRTCFSVLAPGTYAVSEVRKPGWVQTTPVNPSNPLVTVTPGGPAVNLLFGNWRPVVPDDRQDGAASRD
jgi:hypothetical protein